MDFYTQIMHDFFFMLDLCKRPKDAFPEDSFEYELAQSWLDKLCHLKSTSLNERRWRNVYMSYLLVCLNSGRMLSPFDKMPPQGPLLEFDISGNGTCVSTNMGSDCGIVTMSQSPVASLNAFPQHSKQSAQQAFANELCHAPTNQTVAQMLVESSKQGSLSSKIPSETSKPSLLKSSQWESCTSKFPEEPLCECRCILTIRDPLENIGCCCICNCSQSQGLSDERTKPIRPRKDTSGSSGQQKLAPPLTLQAAPPVSPPSSPQTPLSTPPATSPPISPPKNESKFQCNCKLSHQSKVDCARAYIATCAALQSANSAEDTASDHNSMYDDITELLEAISAELRGEKAPGTDDYLEKELVRYKEFLMKHSSMAVLLGKTRSEFALRSFLLLNLQNDLVKLLSERNYN